MAHVWVPTLGISLRARRLPFLRSFVCTARRFRRPPAPLYENPTGLPVGGVEEGRRGFLGIGRRSGRAMPLHALSALRPSAPEERSTARMLDALSALRGRRAGRLTLQLTPAQQQDLVNRYAQTRWFGPIWRPFRRVTERQFRWWRRLAHAALLLVVLAGLGVALGLYYREVATVLRLDAADRRDYQRLVLGMRYGEVHRLAMEVLRREDPLEALPPHARCHLVLEAAREKGWHRVDWELEARSRYPRSVWEDRDYMHIFYWTVMNIGMALSGGGELFSDRLGALAEVRPNERRREEESGFVEEGPEPQKAQKAP